VYIAPHDGDVSKIYLRQHHEGLKEKQVNSKGFGAEIRAEHYSKEYGRTGQLLEKLIALNARFSNKCLDGQIKRLEDMAHSGGNYSDIYLCDWQSKKTKVSF
jgi:hypothetical protein